MTNSMRLELFCRLFLGLFVGFLCVTAVLFVRYESANRLPQMIVQSKGASQPLSASAPAVPSSSASQSQPAVPSLNAEERTLIASSTSTFVTFIAAVVVNVLSWRKDKRWRRPSKRDTPAARPPSER